MKTSRARKDFLGNANLISDIEHNMIGASREGDAKTDSAQALVGGWESAVLGPRRKKRDEYQERLSIGLALIAPWSAHHVATLLGVPKLAVWLWVSQYNQRVPESLERCGRQGRCWAFLSARTETAFLGCGQGDEALVIQLQQCVASRRNRRTQNCPRW